MKKWSAATVALAIAAGGCTGTAVHPPRPQSPRSSAQGTASPVVLPSLRLVADFAEPAVSWDNVAFVAFGPGKDQLGYVASRERPTDEPMAFAVAPNGSLWIADSVNLRLAHFSSAGDFLDEISGYGPHSRDLGFVGDRLAVARDSQYGVLHVYGADQRRAEIRLNDDQDRLFITQLVFIGGELLAYLDTPPPWTGPKGLFQIDLAKGGALEEVPGLPTGVDRWMNVDSTDTGEIRVEFGQPDRSVIRPILLDFVSRWGGEAVQLEQGVMTVENFVVAKSDLYMYVKLSAAEPGGDLVGARYLLRVGTSPIVWERLPEPSRADDDVQRRRLTLGPDGRIYLMVIDHDGVRIYRRP